VPNPDPKRPAARVNFFTPEELDELPPLHHARQNPDLVVERTKIQVIEVPPLARVTNREAVIFEGAEPEISPDSTSEND
jgi:hypothetical protein